MKRILIRIVVGILCLIVLSFGAMWFLLTRPIQTTDAVMVFIPRHASVRSALDSVDKHCNLPNAFVTSMFARIYTRLIGGVVQSGWYTFHTTDTPMDILQALFSGDRRLTTRVTIPEGLTYKEIAGVVARKVGIDSADVIKCCERDSVIEGYLMPDTYEFFWKEDACSIVDRLKKEWQRAIGELKPSHDVVVLASIVQAEAASMNEMPRIAGVYANRLRLGMKLQADPTVQYGMQSRRRLLYADLARDHAWNTYTRAGLPPTPINNPGVAAIKAAMQPERHEFLYFVAKGDSSGEHRFAATSSGHAGNVRLYRSKR